MKDVSLPTKSPLELKRHLFTFVSVKANPAGKSDGPLHMDQNINFSRVPASSNQWNLELELKLTSENPDKPFFYEIQVQLVGTVEVDPQFPEDKKEQLAVANGLGILYGAAREMVINLTARSVYGPMLLPTASFTGVTKDFPNKESSIPKHPTDG